MVKPHLEKLAEDRHLLPEIARRLGDKNYTKAVKSFPDDLLRFASEPQSFLKETILELSQPQQAAMTLVFLARSRLPEHAVGNDECKLVAEKFGVSVSATTEALGQLVQAFLLKRLEGGHICWGFVHPTFADAISSILSDRPDLVGLYVRGTRLENLLSEAICEGASLVRDAVTIPTSSFDAIVGRLVDTPDSTKLNEKLFSFLSNRCPSGVAKKVLEIDPSILKRQGDPSPWQKVAWDNRVRLHALAHKLGVLDSRLRLLTSYHLEAAALESLDVSFLSNDDVLQLFQPTELMRLTVKLVAMLEDDMRERISDLVDSADPDADIEDQFSPLAEFVRQMSLLVEENGELQERTRQREEEIDEAKKSVESRKSRVDSTDDWQNITPSKVTVTTGGRSVFSDVDD